MILPSEGDFKAAIEGASLDLGPRMVDQAARFAAILHRENQKQNLTRILGVGEFVSDHLLDAIELIRAPALGGIVADLGTGSGVPGLLAAALDEEGSRQWFLIESEINKANYLRETAKEMGLERANVVHGRIETVLSQLKPDTVTARALGNVEKISAWIWSCSTWNNLLLFKSRGWQEEWNEAKTSRFGKKRIPLHSSRQYPRTHA